MLKKLIELRLARLKQTSAERRAEESRGLLALKRELDDIYAELSGAAQPQRPAPSSGGLFAGDAEQLREQADLVRDSQDKLRRELARLDELIAEAEAEQRLERSLRELLFDQELFGEQMRALRSDRLAGETPKAGSGPGGELTPNEDFRDGSLSAGSQLSASTPLGTEKLQNAPQYQGAGHRLALLRQRRLQLVEQMKQLQLEYDRLQERIEKMQ